MKISDILGEAASTGATASGNIAAVTNPAIANPSRNTVGYTGSPGKSGTVSPKQPKVKKQTPRDNALNKSNSLFGAGAIKRNTGTALASLDSSKITKG